MTGLPASTSRRAPEPGLRITLPGSRGGLAWLAVLLVVGAFLAFQVGRQVYASWSISQEADAYRAQIAELEAQNAAYAEELAYLQSDAFVSAEARRLRTIGLPNERVLIIPPGAAVAAPAEEADAGTPAPPPIWQWIDLFFAR